MARQSFEVHAQACQICKIFVFQSMTVFEVVFIICSFSAPYFMYTAFTVINNYIFQIYVTKGYATNIFNNLVTYSNNVSGLYSLVSCLM